ncbi:MAG TPA: hypothetical protein ENK26_11390 [Gammaproteobacteria bacterium]|nr:hypothetical protein [Gammaproteobacteria bacterium]
MKKLPDAEQQIVQTHATLIVASVQAAQSGLISPEFEQALNVSAQNGWTALVAALRKIIAGDRSSAVLQGLDEEDQTIVRAVLRGIQDPATLPDPAAQADASVAAPGLAALIHGARAGQPQALRMLAGMAEQMVAAGGDFARLGGMMKRLVDGERDIDKLAQGMGAQGRSLLNSILEELAKLDIQ